MKSLFFSFVTVVTISACGAPSVKTSSADNLQSASTNNGKTNTSAAPVVGQCRVDSADVHACVAFVGTQYTTATMQDQCGQIGGTFSATACDTAGTSGSCDLTVTSRAGYEAKYYYDGMSFEAMTASCNELGGTLLATGPATDDTSGTCSGTADPCAKLGSQTSCGQQKGCAWYANVCEGEIPNTSYICDDWTSGPPNYEGEYACIAAPGCEWVWHTESTAFGECKGGIHSCKEMNQDQCNTAASTGNRFSCRWAPATGECRGWASACSTLTTGSACGAQSGCSWK